MTVGLTMTGIDQFTRMVNIFVYSILAIAALGAGIFFILKKKGWLKKKQEKDVDYSKAKEKDILEFLGIDDIKENMIITDERTRFIAGVKTNGVEYYNGTNREKARTITSYIEYVNSISTLTKMYIQATEDDVSGFIDYFDGLIKKHTAQLNVWLKDIDQLKQSIRELASDEYEGRQLLSKTLEDKQVKVENVKWMIERINHKKYFVVQSSSGEERDKAESYIFVEYEKPSSFDDFTEDEIMKKARSELDNHIKNIIRGHSKAGVDCTPLDGNELGRILRSAYNPLDGDKFKFQDMLKSNMFSLVATGESSTELKMKALLELEEEVEKEGTQLAS